MAAIYGAKFSSAWGEFDENGSWLAELAGYTRAGVARGIKCCRLAVRDAARAGDKAWPPQPIEFAALCEPRPEDFGMPSVADAWREAVEHSHAPTLHRWSHEAARLAGEMAGWSNIQENRRLERGKTPAQMFAEHYDALANRAIAGEPLNVRHLIESDAHRSPAELAERAGRERAAQEAERYSSLTTHTDALSTMRAMLNTGQRQ